MPTDTNTLYEQLVLPLIEQLHQLAHHHGMAVVVAVQHTALQELPDGSLLDDVATLAFCPEDFKLGPSMQVHLGAVAGLEQCHEHGMVPNGTVHLHTDMTQPMLDAMQQGTVLDLGSGHLPAVNSPEGD